ncbi:MAG: hypothetical protein IT365_04490 [Candidatus Hydrogenedentes bacterium]|nr:hypothetical protein [Candidatus Hydrogenedentota bacterium]
MQAINPDECFILMGGGSQLGRLERLDPATGSLSTAAEYGRGHGCYALDRRNNQETIGTRGGRVDLFTLGGLGRDAAQAGRCLRLTGQAVEAVAIGEDLIAAADMSGVYVWRNTAAGIAQPPVRLETGLSPICALVALREGLWGLARDGSLLNWMVDRTKPIATIAAPRPPRKTALVRLIASPDEASLSWPARGGLLATYNLHTGTISAVPAHEGSFYVLLPQEETLLTVGRHDRRVKQWLTVANRPLHVWEGPPDVTAGTFLPGIEEGLLLLDGTGRATAYRFESQALSPMYTVDSATPFRSVAGQDRASLQAYREALRRAEVEGFAAAIESGHLPDGFSTFDDVVERMVALGYGHVALELQADLIRSRGTDTGAAWVEELSVRVRQAEYLDDRAPTAATLNFLQRQAELHEALFQFGPALECRRRLEALEAGNAGDLRKVEMLCEAEAEGRLTVVPGEKLTLADVVAGSEVVGQSVRSFISVTRLQPILTHHVAVTAEEVMRELDVDGLGRLELHAREWMWFHEGACRTSMTLCMVELDPSSGIRRAVACPFPAVADDVRAHVVVSVTPGDQTVCPEAKAMRAVLDAIHSSEFASWAGRCFKALIWAVGRAVNAKRTFRY